MAVEREGKEKEELSLRCEEMGRRVGKYREGLEGSRAEAAQVRDDFGRLEAENEQLRKSLRESQMLLRETAGEVARAREEVEVEKAEWMQEVLQESRHQQSGVEEECQRLRGEVEEARAACQRLEEESRGYKEEVERLRGEKKGLGKEVAEVEAQCYAFQDRVEKLEKKVRNYRTILEKERIQERQKAEAQGAAYQVSHMPTDLLLYLVPRQACLALPAGGRLLHLPHLIN